MARFEPALFALFLVAWLGALLGQLRLVPLAGLLDLGLYPLFTVAAALGWVAGNVYLHRRRRSPPAVRRKLFVIYLVGPPGLLYLLRAMAPRAVQQMAPLVPLLAFAVFVVFFLVPITLPGEWSRPVDQIQGDEEER